MDIKLHSEPQYDILVAGAGLAGIRAAVSCAQEGMRVLMVTPSRLCSGSSFYPLMDTIHCLCTSGPEDREPFMEDIRGCSWSMNDPWMSLYYVDHIRECLERMPEMGIQCRRLPEKKLACFGRTQRDLYCWNDWDSLRSSVRETLGRQPLITVAERVWLAHILTGNGQVNGAVLVKPEGPEALPFKAVILASGGMGDLYLHSLNTPDIAGSAHAIAMKAGARLINLEFNQFIPGFLSPSYKTVFREGSLRYCTGLLGPDGNDVLRQMLPGQEEYDRCLLLREPHGPFTTADDSKYFDIALMESALRNIAAAQGPRNSGGPEIGRGRKNAAGGPAGCVIQYSPDILKDKRSYVRDYTDWLLREHGVHIERDPITIAPFFHAANGGIQVDHGCGCQVLGLFACGEAAGGIHGADRLGGMASGSCLVFGTLAARSACAYARGVSPSPVSYAQARRQMEESFKSCAPYPAKDSGADRADPWRGVPASLSGLVSGAVSDAVSDILGSYICKRIKELMWQRAGVIRSAGSLESALEEINTLALLADTRCRLDSCSDTGRLRAFLKAHQYADLSRALLLSMLERKESRGSHYRKDAPQRGGADFLYRASVGLVENQYSVRRLDAPGAAI